MRILIDCCLTTDWETFLKEAGFDALHWRKVGAADAADDQIVEWAANNDAIVLTQDLDFGSILATQGLTKPSVVQIRSDSPAPEDVGALVTQTIATYADELGAGAIVTVHTGYSKIRVLPLK